MSGPLKIGKFRWAIVSLVALATIINYIDRGALGDTCIGDGVIIDNHVQIAHNVSVGDNTAMAAYSGAAGSATIGKNCIFAGDACVVGHVNICDNVTVMARTLVTK